MTRKRLVLKQRHRMQTWSSMNSSTVWNFYLVTTEYDTFVKERVTQKDRPIGLFLDKDNHKVWVKTWAEIVRDCEGRLNFIQERLRVEVSAKEIEEKIATLKGSIVKPERERIQGQAGSSASIEKK